MAQPSSDYRARPAAVRLQFDALKWGLPASRLPIDQRNGDLREAPSSGTFSEIPGQYGQLSPRSEALKLGAIKQVACARLVAGMEEQLLIAWQARHVHTARRALVERLWRIVELPAAKVGLEAIPGCVEDHGVNVDPTATISDHLDTDWSPVSLDAIAPPLQNEQCRRLIASVQRQVEVTV
jgi:hypothetical protein